MMKTNRISDAQYAFLRDVRDGTLSLGELKEKHKLDEKRFSRWMRGIGFRRGLAVVLRESKRRRHLELQLASNVAAEMLALAVQKKIKLEAQEVMLLERVGIAANREEQARRAARRAQRRGRGGAGRKKLPSPDDELCHPAAKAQEDELLAILEGGESKA